MGQYCLECGARLALKILERRNRNICLECGWIYYPQLKVTAGVLVERDSKLLLVQRANEPWKGRWYLPAGYVEDDESPKRAAEREAREETGLKISAEKLIDVYYYDDDLRGNGLLILYSGIVQGGKINKNNEAAEIKFLSIAEIKELKLAGGSHNIAINEWLKMKEKGSST